ncbi:nucleotidyl transferase AbiEii/AbiGii toxin family protein [Geobacter sp.]|uniref:nucleotidyl transferase AbiEii/AbiGii toxin family protein n=1 Tax=Geobacter sp. TaxID=46610 RepID=UPI0027BA95BE|nr:nucleotidyl transferase AbiEii/AbiGii toxin family protein [Geobacter sp.]
MISEFHQAIDVLESLWGAGGIDGYALVGGLAVSVWATPRATEDIDILVLVAHDKGLESFTEALRAKGIEFQVHRGGVDDPVPLLVTAEIAGIPLDCIIATKKWEAEAVQRAVGIEFMGKTVRVLAPEYLIVMKLKAGGPQDLLDAARIVEQSKYDRELLDALAKRLKVTKRLEKLRQA